jgi:hypothetical protein
MLYPQGKSPQYPLDRMLGGPKNQSGRCGENSWPYWHSNSTTSIVQPIASHYTDYAIPAHKYNIKLNVKKIQLENVDWIHLAHKGTSGKALVTSVMNFQTPKMAGNFSS